MAFGRRLKKLGKKTGKAFKGAGKVIKDTATSAGGAVKKTAKATGKVVKKAAKATGGTVKKGAVRTGSAVKKTAKTTGRVVKNTAKRTGGAAKKTSRAIKKGAKVTGRTVKNTAKKVLKTSDFRLNCHFLICHSEAHFSDKEVQSWINERVLLAEKLYNRKPKLKIKSSFSRVKNGDGLLVHKFLSGRDYSKFMNEKFDNTSGIFKAGRLNFLVINKWYIDDSAPCGRAFFNFYPGWKKHAILLGKHCRVDTFSHELGHVFGLMHTFAKGGLCTHKYAKREGSTLKDGRSNLMDYKREATVYLNRCQALVSAQTRRRYMTITGKIKYFKLSGIL